MPKERQTTRPQRCTTKPQSVESSLRQFAPENKWPPLSAGTEAVRQYHLGLLDDSLKLFRKGAQVSEIMFLADALFAWGSYENYERRDTTRCFIADLLLDRLTMRPEPAEAETAAQHA